MEVKFPDVSVKLVGEDGNIFSIIGRISKALRRAGHSDVVEEFQKEITSSSSYDEALGVAMKWVEVE